MNKPWLAAMLNVIPVPIGSGYLFLQRPRRFAANFFAALVALFGGFVIFASLYLACWQWSCWWNQVLIFLAALAPISLLALFTAWDAWRIAKAGLAPTNEAGRSVMKKPWLAAMLNVIPVPMGLGYVYLGRPHRFLVNFLSALVAAFLGLVALVLAALSCMFGGCDPSGAESLAISLGIFGPIVVVALFFAWDAYRTALEHNAIVSAENRRGKPLAQIDRVSI